MTEMNIMIRNQAIAWAIRTREPDFADWDDFAQWLEMDSLHNIAYEDISLAADDYIALAANIEPCPSERSDTISILRQPANDGDGTRVVPAKPETRRRVLSGAIAASLLVAVGAGVWTRMPQPYAVVTAPGQREIVTLPDGSRIMLNGDTRIELDHRQPRHAGLDRGEALFTIVHDDSDPFIVDTGNVRLVDAGTEFNVVKSDTMLDVTVSEGLVIYNPERENVSLAAGKRLYRDARRNRVTVSDISVEQVGSWRAGQLRFAGETLGQVMEALNRNLGVTITASETIAARPFSGVIQLEQRDPQNVPAIAALLGVRAEKQEKGWVLIGDDAVP